jgi:hypothetical protein
VFGSISASAAIAYCVCQKPSVLVIFGDEGVRPPTTHAEKVLTTAASALEGCAALT